MSTKVKRVVLKYGRVYCDVYGCTSEIRTSGPRTNEAEAREAAETRAAAKGWAILKMANMRPSTDSRAYQAICPKHLEASK